MKSLHTLILAATLAFPGIAGGYAGDAQAGQTAVNQAVLNQKGSLARLGSINDLFANSRGGDQVANGHGPGGGAGKASYQGGNDTKPGDGSVTPAGDLANPNGGGAQLPAVQKVREAASRQSVTPGALPTDLAGTGGTQQGLLLPAVQAAREAARSSSGAGTSGGAQANPGLAKGLNVTNAARK